MPYVGMKYIRKMTWLECSVADCDKYEKGDRMKKR